MQTLTRTLLVATLILGATLTHAEDTDGFESSLNAGAILTDGNSDTQNANIGLDTHRIEGKNEFNAKVNFNYGKTEGVTVVNKLQADAQARRNLEKKAYAYLGGDYLADDIAKLDYRVTVGPGVGTDLLHGGDTRLNVELGAVVVGESVAEVPSSTFAALRLAEIFQYKISDSAKIWQSATYVPEWDDFDNYTLMIELGAKSDMTERISLRLVFQNRYDSTPATEDGVELEKNDISLIAGLGVKL